MLAAIIKLPDWSEQQMAGGGKKKQKTLTLFQHFFQTVNYCVVVWFEKDDSFLIGKHTEGNTVSYTSEKMWSSSDRVQMLLRNML